MFNSSHLVFIHNPTLELLVVPIVTTPLLDNIVNGEMFKAGALGKAFAVGRFAYTRRASHYDIWLIAHIVYCGGTPVD